MLPYLLVPVEKAKKANDFHLPYRYIGLNSRFKVDWIYITALAGRWNRFLRTQISSFHFLLSFFVVVAV